MKRLKVFLAILLTALLFLTAMPVSFGFSAVAVDTEKSAIVNTLYKLNVEKELTVGYFGGSVTAGTGSSNANEKSWRALTRSFISEAFPKAKITERNSSIGGTGAIFGVFRADSQYIKDKAPDLNFIEMCVNDSYDGVYNSNANYVYIETIIRKIYASNPNADIVFVIVGDNGTMKNEVTSEKEPYYGRPYTRIAEYYKLPILYPARELAFDIYEENGKAFPASDSAAWKKYFSDSVHPNDTGYAHYAATVNEFLKINLPSDTVPAKSDFAVKKMPDKSFCETNDMGELIPDAYLVSPDELSGKDTNLGGFSVVESGNYKPLVSAREGDSITLKFNAKSFGIWTWSYGTKDGINGTDIIYSVDGGKEQKLNIYRSFPNHKIYFLAENLSSGEHTVTVTHVDDKASLDIRYFLLCGLPSNIKDEEKGVSAVDARATETSGIRSAFTDVDKQNVPLARAVNLIYGLGITKGTTATTFGTNEYVSRQQMAAFIYRLMKPGKSGENGDNITKFTDLIDPYYNYVISWASENGIIKGTTETAFNPRGYITLQDAYVMLVRALGHEKETPLGYPTGYIGCAESIKLDENLPAELDYTRYLTRGNIAILLSNAFSADMATGTTEYESSYEIVELSNGKKEVVDGGKMPVTKYDTVAEKIYGVEKTVQRIVATKNYCLDDYKKTDELEGVDMVTLDALDRDYLDDKGLFAEVDFEEFNLPGTGDDYFLIDLAIYYRPDEGEGKQIVFAVPLGERKKNVGRDKVVFEKMTGSSKEVFYNGNEEDRTRRLTGKVTVDGVVSYLFNAPYTYSTPAVYEDKERDDIDLLFLDATTRDYEDMETFEQDFNFKSHRDVVGHNAEWYTSMLRKSIYYVGNSEETVLSNVCENDKRGGGLYSDWGIYMYMGLDINSSPYFEVDVWDSNGDGKIDYMWTKPYTVGKAIVKDGKTFRDYHYSEGFTPIRNICAVYSTEASKYHCASIYFDGASVEGTYPDDGQLFVGYINAPANYIKSVYVNDWTPVEKKLSRLTSNATSIYFSGELKYLWGTPVRLLGAPNASGMSQQYFTIVGRPLTDYDRQHYFTSIVSSSGAYVSKYFKVDNVGKSFNIVMYDRIIIYAEPVEDAIGADSDFAFVYPDKNGKIVTSPMKTDENGMLKIIGHYLPVMINGEITDVPVDIQNLKTDASRPFNEKLTGDIYDFSAYAGEPLSYEIDSHGTYTLSFAPLADYSNKDVLATAEASYYYAYNNDADVDTSFVKKGSDLYQFCKTAADVEAPDPDGKISKALKGLRSTMTNGTDGNGVWYVRCTPDAADHDGIPKLDQYGLNINTTDYPYMKICYRTSNLPGTDLYIDVGLGVTTKRFKSESQNTWESVLFKVYTGKTVKQYHFACVGSLAAADLAGYTSDLMYVGFFKTQDDAIAYRDDVSGTVRIDGTSYPPVEDENFNKKLAPSKYVQFTENTRVVVKTVDDDGEAEFTVYNKDDMPDFERNDTFTNVHYLVRNNPKSTTVEELIYMYMEAKDGKTHSSSGDLDIRIIKGAAVSMNEDDEITVKYEAYNPYNGKTEEYELEDGGDTVDKSLYGGIFSVNSAGHLDAGKLMGRIDALGDNADSTSDASTTGLGLSVVDEYDKQNSFLALGGDDILYRVTDDTVVTFLNLEDETIKIVDKDVLSSTSKTYRCGENKDAPLVVFAVSEEDSDDEDFELATSVVIVRADSLEDAIG